MRMWRFGSHKQIAASALTANQLVDRLCGIDCVGNGLHHRCLQQRRAILVEQAQLRGRDAAQVVAALSGHLQQLGAGRGDQGQGVAAELSRVSHITQIQCSFMASFFCPTTMNTHDEQFFKELGARIAQARKEHSLTQQQLFDQSGVPHQTLAHYEVGRTRLPASMLPTLARMLTLSLDEPMGQPLSSGTAKAGAQRRGAKRGLSSQLHQQIDAIVQLPKAKQQFVSQMLDTVMAQATR